MVQQHSFQMCDVVDRVRGNHVSDGTAGGGSARPSSADAALQVHDHQRRHCCCRRRLASATLRHRRVPFQFVVARRRCEYRLSMVRQSLLLRSLCAFGFASHRSFSSPPRESASASAASPHYSHRALPHSHLLHKHHRLHSASHHRAAHVSSHRTSRAALHPRRDSPGVARPFLP